MIKFSKDAMIGSAINHAPLMISLTTSYMTISTYTIDIHFILIGITNINNTVVSGYVSEYARKTDKLI